MRLRTVVTSAVAAYVGVALGGCVAAQSPAPEASVSPAVATAVAAPASDWQWNDAPAGPSVTLHSAAVAPASSPAHTASFALVCSDSAPSMIVAWDAPIAPAGQATLTYRFDGQPAYDVAAQSTDAQSEVVSDPLTVSQFVDRAAGARQLVVRVSSPAGAAQATFSTSDDAGNLTRFRTVCPDGTN